MWRALNRRDPGLLGLLDELLSHADSADPRLLARFRPSDTLLVTSDYGGEHDAAAFYSYSFLVLTGDAFAAWEPTRVSLRSTLGLTRTMSFKRLSDRERRDALPRFLAAAGALTAFSFSLLVDKQIDSLFRKVGRLDLRDPKLAAFNHWKPRSFEKALRVTHILGFLLAGLAQPNQNVLWFTDQDEIAANPDRLGDLTRMLGNITSALVPHNLGHLRCGTTASDNGTKQLEDLTAIPDLIIGAIGESLSEGGVPFRGLFLPSPASISSKGRAILDWFSDSRLPLRRMVLAVEPVPGSTALTVSDSGSTDLRRTRSSKGARPADERGSERREIRA